MLGPGFVDIIKGMNKYFLKLYVKSSALRSQYVGHATTPGFSMGPVKGTLIKGHDRTPGTLANAVQHGDSRRLRLLDVDVAEYFPQRTLQDVDVCAIPAALTC